MGVRGIARDLAASGLGAMKSLNVPAINGEGPGPDVRTEDQEGCPAFFARSVRGVKNGPSPEWLQKRLKAIGQNPISTFVDITNFIMFYLGRPLHFFDMSTLICLLFALNSFSFDAFLSLSFMSYRLYSFFSFFSFSFSFL